MHPMALFPPDHPERIALADEVHARPSEVLNTPAQATYLAVLIDPDAREREVRQLQALCRRQGVDAPADGASHFRTRFGDLRLKWERHGEFSSYTVIRSGIAPSLSSAPFADPAAKSLPAGWLASLPGPTIAAVHLEFLATDAAAADIEAGDADAGILTAAFGHHPVTGARVADGAARVYSDFRIHDDGCTRFLVFDHGLTPGQCGRLLQRLAEIEAYRTLALLALPIARRQSPRIVQIEQALAHLTDGSMSGHSGQSGQPGASDDEALLQQLTQLAAEIESGLSASQFRFGACKAYDALVRRRIAELREQRLPGLQTIEEFMSRRFVPAVATCNTVSQRLHDLSERVAQASGLLSTRVDILRERQNQSLLASMDRRAKLQLRLQQTVEGLSVAAITYYAVGLVGYVAKALKAGGMPWQPDVVTGLAVPLVAIAVLLAVRRARKRVMRAEKASDPEGSARSKATHNRKSAV